MDPEYVWLRKGEAKGYPSVGADREDENAERKRTSSCVYGANGDAMGRVKSAEKSVPLGSIGVAMQSLGLIWLLSALGFNIPWYSVFPAATMIAGGVLILRAIIHDRKRIKTEAFSDRRNHTRN
ncbi:MAG TPA: hypothetical protein VGK23_09665 [Methanomassiliicoccales archaeon]